MNKAKAVIALAGIILLHSFSWIALKNSVPNIEQENGIMENYQAIWLVVSVVLWIVALRRASVRADKIFFAGLALFTATVLVLEVDFRSMNAPLLNAVMNGKIRNIWLGSFWLAGIILFAKNTKPVLNSFVSWLRTPSAVLMIVGGVFWVVSALIEKAFPGKFYYEELMEVNATLLMAASAALNLFIQKRQLVQGGISKTAP